MAVGLFVIGMVLVIIALAMIILGWVAKAVRWAMNGIWAFGVTSVDLAYHATTPSEALTKYRADVAQREAEAAEQRARDAERRHAERLANLDAMVTGERDRLLTAYPMADRTLVEAYVTALPTTAIAELSDIENELAYQQAAAVTLATSCDPELVIGMTEVRSRELIADLATTARLRLRLMTDGTVFAAVVIPDGRPPILRRMSDVTIASATLDNVVAWVIDHRRDGAVVTDDVVDAAIAEAASTIARRCVACARVN